MEPEIPLLWMFELAILITLGKISESIFSKIGFPRIVGYVFVGLILSLVFNVHMSTITEAFGMLGIIAMLFYAGLESSVREFLRGFKEAGLIALGGVFGSLGVGLLAIPLFNASILSALSLGVILSATSISLTVGTLEELGRLGGRESQAIIGAAVVDDVLGLAMLSMLYGIAQGTFSIVNIISFTALAFGIWFLISIIFQKIARPFFKIAFKSGIEEPLLTLVFALLLFFSYIAAYIRLSAILLAYALGLGLASYRFFAKRLAHEIHPIIALFTPIFFIYAGGIIKLSDLMQFNILYYAYVIPIIIALGFISKIFSCYLTAKLLGFNHVDSLIIGVGMTPRAEVMLIAALMGYKMGLITPGIYVGLILILPTTTITVPPLLKYLYSKKQLR